MTGFDLERRIVNAAAIPGEEREFPYDSLIVAAGAGQSYFGHDEFARYAPGMKTIDDALELRRRIFGAFEMAERPRTRPSGSDWLTIVIVGGRTDRRRAGRADPRAGGAQLAGRVPQHRPGLGARRPRSTAATKPLASFGDRLSDAGGDLRSNVSASSCGCTARVVGVDAFGVDVVEAGRSDARIDAAHDDLGRRRAGVAPGRLLAEASGAETDRAGRIAVLPDLTLPGHPEVFAVGDMVAFEDLPGVAEVAMQGGLHAANTIRRRLKGDTRAVPFRYRDIGSIATIGRFSAIVNFRGAAAQRLPRLVVWLFVHLAFLNGFGNRLTALWRWGRAMVGRGRPERVFSVGHTGGDLSLPEEVRRRVMPSAFPVFDAPAEAARCLAVRRARLGTRPAGPGRPRGFACPHEDMTREASADTP